jgi:hypothetical protein
VLAPHTSTGPLILIVGIALLGCGHAARQPEPGAVVFQDRLVIEETDDKSPLRVPPAQLPQPGECRLWKPQKPLGEQARPGPCAQIEPTAPPESWILYRPSQDPRLVHVRVVDPDWAGRVVQVRVYDAARGTYLGRPASSGYIRERVAEQIPKGSSMPAIQSPQPSPPRKTSKLEPTTRVLGKCPECAGPLVPSSSCVSCLQCGWGQCG